MQLREGHGGVTRTPGRTGWTTRALAECGQLLSGGTPSKAVEDYWGGSIPWISAKSLKSFHVTDSEDRLSEAGARHGSRLVPSGTVLFVVRGMSLANEFRVGVARRAVAFNQDVRALVPHDDVIPEYLAHYLRASERSVLDLVDAASHGTTRLTSDRIEALPVPIPPLAEQRRIADILDQADALRARRRAALAQVDGLTRAIFLEMFGHPPGNPCRWDIQHLGTLARVVRGASPRPKGDPLYFGGPIPWLMISDVTAEQGSVVTRTKEGVTPAGRDKSVFLKSGTLVVTNSATVGVPKVLGIDACIHDGFLALLDVDSRLNQRFLYESLLLKRRHLEALAPEGTQKNLNIEIAKRIEVPLPPLPLQLQFAARAAAVDKLKASHRASLARLDALFASLQHRAFRGEL